MIKKDFPKIHYYDQDFVDIYDRTWMWLQNYWVKEPGKVFSGNFLSHDGGETVDLFETCMASFFLVYHGVKFQVAPMLDNFYRVQEEDGAIRCKYNPSDGTPLLSKDNPLGAAPPLLGWVEFNLYHKGGQKKRIKEVMPHLERYYGWVEKSFKDEKTGFYSVPPGGTKMDNSPREGMVYPVDFNAQQAMNALYMAALADLLNDRDMSFKYKKKYFALKTRINSVMWNEEEGFYYDLDKHAKPLKVRTAGGFWTLLAEIPNEPKVEKMIPLLKDPKHFGTENPFPSLGVSEKGFNPKGNGFCGSVYPFVTFMIIKGLEKYARYEFARECTIRHMYSILDTFHQEGEKKGFLWEAYQPNTEGAALFKEGENRPNLLAYVGLSTIALMIENVMGLCISLPKKTVDWMVPTLELMGIEDLSLKRNLITILSNKSPRGWEIRLESEKLYYFTIDILGVKRKTLPIPSGRCSMLVDKL